MISYVYMMQPEGMDACKIGHSCNPRDRRMTIQGSSPVVINFVRVVMVESKRVASAYEQIVRGWVPVARCTASGSAIPPNWLRRSTASPPALT